MTTTDTTDLFGLFMSPEVRPDPYPTYARLLAERPVADTGVGVQFVFGHDDCLSLLREFPLQADLDPGFSVADETEIPRLVEESLDRTLHSTSVTISKTAPRHGSRSTCSPNTSATCRRSSARSGTWSVARSARRR